MLISRLKFFLVFHVKQLPTNFFIFQLSQSSLPAHFLPPKVSISNGCLPILRPCISSGIWLKLLSPCEHPATPMPTHQNNNFIFGSSSCVSNGLFVFCLPLPLFLKIWAKQLAWKCLWLKEYLLPGSFKENVNYLRSAGYNFQRGCNSYWATATLELCHLPSEFNKSYWQWLQQRMLVYNHRSQLHSEL